MVQRIPMLKLTRLDQRTVAINPDHVAWVEATPDTTLCLLGDRKIIVRESLDEVVERFIAARASVGCTPIGIPVGPPDSNSRASNRPSMGFRRTSNYPSFPAPRVIAEPDGTRHHDDEGGG